MGEFDDMHLPRLSNQSLYQEDTVHFDILHSSQPHIEAPLFYKQHNENAHNYLLSLPKF